jgi:predicted nucleic-acid-binding protein
VTPAEAASSLDANVMLRLTLKDVPDQFDLAKRLVERPGARFHVSGLALVEYVFALEHHYRLTRRQVSEVVRGLLSIPNIWTDCRFIDSVVDLWSSHPALSFADCYLAEEAKDAGLVPLWTFDRKLANQHSAARQVPGATPGA